VSIALVGPSVLLLGLLQAPFPGAVQVDGAWVPCSHPIAIAAGQSCSPQASTGKRFENGLDYVCFAFENHVKVQAGGHPAVVLMVDIPATDTSDRQICLGLEKP
jgi:hypothetical protein